MPVEQMPSGEQKVGKEIKDENRIVSATEINPEVVKTIKEGDALGVKEATEELKNFAAQETEQAKTEKAELLALAKEKLEEMKTRIDKNKKSFFGGMFMSEKDVAVGKAAVNEAMKKVDRGELPNMHMVMESAKVKVDLSDFERRKGAVLSSGNTAGYNVLGKF